MNLDYLVNFYKFNLKNNSLNKNKLKYLKYKIKYLTLLLQKGSGRESVMEEIKNINNENLNIALKLELSEDQTEILEKVIKINTYCINFEHFKNDLLSTNFDSNSDKDKLIDNIKKKYQEIITIITEIQFVNNDFFKNISLFIVKKLKNTLPFLISKIEEFKDIKEFAVNEEKNEFKTFPENIDDLADAPDLITAGGIPE